MRRGRSSPEMVGDIQTLVPNRERATGALIAHSPGAEGDPETTAVGLDLKLRLPGWSFSVRAATQSASG